MPQSLTDFAPVTKDKEIKKRGGSKKWRSKRNSQAWVEMKKRLKEKRES